MRFLRVLMAALAVLPLWAGPARAQVPDNVIRIRISLKVIVDPATGAVPADMNDALLHDSFNDMNRWLAVNWRGYRLELVDLGSNGNFRRIGGKDDTTGPGKWYAINLKPEVTGGANDQFEDAAKASAASKALYAWNDSAINVYMNNGGWSRARFPSENRAIVITGYTLLRYDPAPGQTWSPSYKVAGNLLHEFGHSFELYHTHSSDHDDGIPDTAPDPLLTAGGRDDTAVLNSIAQFNFKKNHVDLSDAQKLQVSNTANNAMAYYQLFYDDPASGKVVSDAERFSPARFVFTPQQMDKWADKANAAPRHATVSGTMRFVDAAAASSGIGTSASPIKTLSTAVASAKAGGGDILLLRPGSYTAATLTKPMTLRATRQGAVTLKKAMKRISAVRKPVFRGTPAIRRRAGFMKRALTVRLPLLPLLLIAGLPIPVHAQTQSGGPWTVTSCTADSGGGRSAGGGWTVTGTAGQADASPGRATGGAFAVSGGFWTDAAITPTALDGPRLTLAPLDSASLRISWPADATGLTLQKSPDLIHWTDIQTIPRGAGSTTWSLRQGSRFYFRLIQK